MNKLLLGLFALLASTTALAEVTDVDRALVEKGRNVFRNGGAENGRADWSASGGSILANSTAAGSGKLGISWDSSAAAQTLILTSSVNVPESLKGRNGAALCKVKVPSGVGTHTFTVDDGTNNLATAQTITSGTTFSSQVVNFIYPTTATPLRFKFTSVASNEPEIYVDECVATDAFNISQVAQATFYAQMKQVGAANCSVSATPSIGTYSDLATMASCASAWTNTGASVTNSATSLSQTLNGLSPGVYLIKYQGYIASALGQTCYFRFSDGTTTFGRGVIGGGASANNTSGIEGVYTVTSRQVQPLKFKQPILVTPHVPLDLRLHTTTRLGRSINSRVYPRLHIEQSKMLRIIPDTMMLLAHGLFLRPPTPLILREMLLVTLCNGKLPEFRA